ncbi:MAG: hypothetical protein FWE37_00665 [Spirochaetaceae bacterium]|nr:hypothetical protein [Spirochaetaceae bacterium]
MKNIKLWLLLLAALAFIGCNNSRSSGSGNNDGGGEQPPVIGGGNEGDGSPDGGGDEGPVINWVALPTADQLSTINVSIANQPGLMINGGNGSASVSGAALTLGNTAGASTVGGVPSAPSTSRLQIVVTVNFTPISGLPITPIDVVNSLRSWGPFGNNVITPVNNLAAAAGFAGADITIVAIPN